MEKLTEFFSHIKERFSNPFIFSFLCSWLIFNWPVTIALLWYDRSQIKSEGFVTIYDFIAEKTNNASSIGYPILFALAYTFIAPIFRNIVRAFYAWVEKWGTNWNLLITKGGKVSIEKFLRLRTDYDKRTRILEEVITQESENTNKFISLNTEVLTLKKELNTAKQATEDLRNQNLNMNAVSMLNGYWTNRFTHPNGQDGVENVYIENGNYYILTPNGGKNHVFNISDFIYYASSRSMFFIKGDVHQRELYKDGRLKYNFNRLEFQTKDRLVGHENGNTPITYTRKAV